MCYAATDAFVLVFSIRDPNSLHAVKNKFLREIESYREANPRRNVPIILVGQHAECRSNPAFAAQAVSSQDVVTFAHDVGILKYIEIHSNNLRHVNEVFRQLVLAVDQARNINTSMSAQEYRAEFDHHDTMLRKYLTVRAPEGSFDTFHKTFSLENLVPDTTYLISLNGDPPTRVSSRYSGPIKLKRPYPRVIKVIGLSRCRYPSELVTFEVPAETPVPDGHFDVLAKAFFVTVLPSQGPIDIFYTLDGSKPTPASRLYDLNGIYLDQGPHLGGFVSGGLPRSIKILAIEEGLFRSSVAEFLLPDLLDPPVVSYVEKENLLVVEHPLDASGDSAVKKHFEFRYTFDGSIPTVNSPAYTGPILLPPNASVTQIRVASFPKLFFPSHVVEVQRTMKEFKHASPGRNVSPPKSSVRMTKSSAQRALENARAQGTVVQGTILGDSGATSPPPSKNASSSPFASRSATLSSPPQQQGSAGSSSTPSPVFGHSATTLPLGGSSSPSRRQVSPRPQGSGSPRGGGSRSPERRPAHRRRPDFPVRPQRGLKAPPTPEEQRRAIRAKASAQYYPQSNTSTGTTIRKSAADSASFRGAAEETQSIRPEWLASCKVEDTTIVFSFTREVVVDHLQVTTPGQGRGPTAFVLFGAPSEDTAPSMYHVMGQGRLFDEFGEQKADVESKMRTLPIRVLRVEFDSPGSAEGAYQVLDLKLFGALPSNEAVKRASSTASLSGSGGGGGGILTNGGGSSAHLRVSTPRSRQSTGSDSSPRSQSPMRRSSSIQNLLFAHPEKDEDELQRADSFDRRSSRKSMDGDVLNPADLLRRNLAEKARAQRSSFGSGSKSST